MSNSVYLHDLVKRVYVLAMDGGEKAPNSKTPTHTHTLTPYPKKLSPHHTP